MKNGKTLVEAIDFDVEGVRVNGRDYVLDALIPDEHAKRAQNGEWDEEGFIYEVGRDWFIVVMHDPFVVEDCDENAGAE